MTKLKHDSLFVEKTVDLKDTLPRSELGESTLSADILKDI